MPQSCSALARRLSQPATKTRRVGVLAPASAEWRRELVQALEALGYREGQNVVLEGPLGGRPPGTALAMLAGASVQPQDLVDKLLDEIDERTRDNIPQFCCFLQTSDSPILNLGLVRLRPTFLR